MLIAKLEGARQRKVRKWQRKKYNGIKNINLTGVVTQNCLFSSDRKIYNYSKCFKLNPKENFLEQDELSMVLRKFSVRFSIFNMYQGCDRRRFALQFSIKEPTRFTSYSWQSTISLSGLLLYSEQLSNDKLVNFGQKNESEIADRWSRANNVLSQRASCQLKL